MHEMREKDSIHGMREKAKSLRRAVDYGMTNGKTNMIVDLDVLLAIFRGEIPVGGNEFPPEKVTELLYEVKAERDKFLQACHASAPAGHKCSDCTIDKEPCSVCYSAWWKKRHPNTVQMPDPIDSKAQDWRLGLSVKPKFRQHEMYYEPPAYVVAVHDSGFGGVLCKDGVLVLEGRFGVRFLAPAEDWVTA